MNIACDFDGTLVGQGHSYDDLDTPLQFLPGAKEAVRSLHRAGHILLLWSARASRALLEDPTLCPLVRAGVKTVDLKRWADSWPVNQARYHQMVDFVARELPGIFSAIDDGMAGKPSVDLFIDDKCLRLGDSGRGVGWSWIETVYGAPEYGTALAPTIRNPLP